MHVSCSLKETEREKKESKHVVRKLKVTCLHRDVIVHVYRLRNCRTREWPSSCFPRIWSEKDEGSSGGNSHKSSAIVSVYSKLSNRLTFENFHQAIVTAEPDVVKYPLRDEDEFVSPCVLTSVFIYLYLGILILMQV